MREKKPSRTALGVAFLRAAHQLLDRPLVFTDPLAARILGRIWTDALQRRSTRRLKGRLSRRLRGFLSVRSRIAEDTLATLVDWGISQYVILGAGLDTFGYRNPYPGLRVFEVDHPATQAWKRRLVADAGLEPAGALRYVPVDFERQNFGAELERAGFARDAGAFFSWLGVTLYLEENAVMATLRYVAEATKAGGGIVLDYGATPRSLPWRQRLAVRAMALRVRLRGEPWRSYFDPAALSGQLKTMGFTGVEDLGGKELNSKYFAGRDDGLGVAGFGHIVRAFGGSGPPDAVGRSTRPPRT